MKVFLFFVASTLLLSACNATKKVNAKFVTITKSTLEDKIAGGWAGKMIGVSYGTPTEFKAQGRIYEEAISWKPTDVEKSQGEDDIYVQLTFMETMDRYGMDAPVKKYQELLATAGYRLWHANVQARKNFHDSIFPPQSGHPDYNLHADDIDFQIEADYIGFMCPGMPQTANKMADKIGHIMNYGEGVYGGVFVAALYAEAYVQNDIPSIVNKALLSLPAESDYYKIIQDVIILHKQYPTNWRKSWQELENKWGRVNICEAGKLYNIDAKLNGAYIVVGLLYGEGDVDKTMEIATRCGQDSDCNPSNAVAILGVIKGFSGLPATYREAVKQMDNSLFVHTNYSFNTAVKKTMDYASKIISGNGGRITENEITIALQEPVAFPMEDAFPGIVFSKRLGIVDADQKEWKLIGTWTPDQDNTAICSNKAGDEISLTFEGTGVSIEGWWVKDGGKADVYVDGTLKGTIDCFFYYSDQEHKGINIYHILNLPEGKHTVKLVVKGEKRMESAGCIIGVTGAVVYKTSEKGNEDYKFSFQ